MEERAELRPVHPGHIPEPSSWAPGTSRSQPFPSRPHPRHQGITGLGKLTHWGPRASGRANSGMWKSHASSELVELQHCRRMSLRAPGSDPQPRHRNSFPEPRRTGLPKAMNGEWCCSKKASGQTPRTFCLCCLRAYGSSGLGIGFPGLEGCVSQEVGGQQGPGSSSWKGSSAPAPTPSPSSDLTWRRFRMGRKYSGGLDSKDDAGDQEKGAPPQAEPEGVLGQRMGVSTLCWEWRPPMRLNTPSPPRTQQGASGRDLRPEEKDRVWAHAAATGGLPIHEPW